MSPEVTVNPSTSSEVPSEVLDKSHDLWTDAETQFLIASIHPLLKHNDNLPVTLGELENRMKMNRGKKGQLFDKLAQLLSAQFCVNITGKQVSRKWFTLVDGYKKAICNNGTTGQGPSRFKWLKEMGDLIGGQHDVNPVLTCTEQGVTVHRPDVLSVKADGESETESKEASGEGGKPEVKNKRRKRKADEVGNELLCFMKESEERSAEFERKLLVEMSDMTDTMKKIIDKL